MHTINEFTDKSFDLEQHMHQMNTSSLAPEKGKTTRRSTKAGKVKAQKEESGENTFLSKMRTEMLNKYYRSQSTNRYPPTQPTIANTSNSPIT